MRTGRPKPPLTVLPADQEKLELLARRPKTAQRMALRSKIVLRAGKGLANQEIARQLNVTGATVGKWRERYRIRGMGGLCDDPRPGTPRKITDTDPLGKSATFAYNAASYMTSTTDRLGRRRDFTYDGAGFKTGETWKNADTTTANILNQIAFTFNVDELINRRITSARVKRRVFGSAGHS